MLAVSIERPIMAKSKRYHSSIKSGPCMISEDRSAISNLPQGVIMKEYPKNDYATYNLNDDLLGIDNQISDDSRGVHRKSKEKFPKKY